jgi:putative endonuclease
MTRRERMKKGYTYIITNYRRTVLYTGVTGNLARRMTQYKNGTGSVFATKYRLKYLVYYEEHPSMYLAIQREKQIKNWHREWKINLIKSVNPEMRDLSEELF